MVSDEAVRTLGTSHTLSHPRPDLVGEGFTSSFREHSSRADEEIIHLEAGVDHLTRHTRWTGLVVRNACRSMWPHRVKKRPIGFSGSVISYLTLVISHREPTNHNPVPSYTLPWYSEYVRDRLNFSKKAGPWAGKRHSRSQDEQKAVIS